MKDSPIQQMQSATTASAVYAVSGELNVKGMKALFQAVSADAVFGYEDLDNAVAQWGAAQTTHDAVQVADDWDDTMITDSLIAERILKDIFGSAAYIVRRIGEDVYSKECLRVIEAHYAWPVDGNEATLIQKHDAFLTRYSREVPVASQRMFTLESIPSDADYAL